jgi:hypothetical protein
MRFRSFRQRRSTGGQINHLSDNLFQQKLRIFKKTILPFRETTLPSKSRKITKLVRQFSVSSSSGKTGPSTLFLISAEIFFPRRGIFFFTSAEMYFFGAENLFLRRGKSSFVAEIFCSLSENFFLRLSLVRQTTVEETFG